MEFHSLSTGYTWLSTWNSIVFYGAVFYVVLSMGWIRRQPGAWLSTEVVDVTLGVDNQKMAVGGRLKEARSALGLTQKELCALIEKPLPSLRDYELGKSIPGGEAVAGLVRAGINANWLLTGEGPMLLADLVKAAEAPKPTPVDAQLLAEVIGAFYQVLHEERHHYRIDREAHGDVIAVLYKMALANRLTKADVAQVLALAA